MQHGELCYPKIQLQQDLESLMVQVTLAPRTGPYLSQKIPSNLFVRDGSNESFSANYTPRSSTHASFTRPTHSSRRRTSFLSSKISKTFHLHPLWTSQFQTINHSDSSFFTSCFQPPKTLIQTLPSYFKKAFLQVHSHNSNQLDYGNPASSKNYQTWRQPNADGLRVWHWENWVLSMQITGNQDWSLIPPSAV